MPVSYVTEKKKSLRILWRKNRVYSFAPILRELFSHSYSSGLQRALTVDSELLISSYLKPGTVPGISEDEHYFNDILSSDELFYVIYNIHFTM
jgi:hypothetical protein